MPRLSKQQQDQIRDERREQIKQAALKEFARRGYAATKTSVIAAEAGISEGLIFRYFKTKEELFTTLVMELMGEAKKETGDAQLYPGSPYEQMKVITEAMLEESSKYAFMFVQRARKADNIPEEASRILDQNSVDVLLNRLVPVMIKGQQAGEFREGDPMRLLAWYLHIVNSLIMEEVGKENYGMPNADYLMKFLAK